MDDEQLMIELERQAWGDRVMEYSAFGLSLGLELDVQWHIGKRVLVFDNEHRSGVHRCTTNY